MRNFQPIITYQLFRREFVDQKGNFSEWAFTYLLKCFYFPKYFRPEYLKWSKDYAEKELCEELTGGKFNEEEQLIFTDKVKEKQWDKLIDSEKNFLDGNFNREFIKYALAYTPYDNNNFNIPTDEQVEKIYQAFQLIPKKWKEKQPWYQKQPWYPYSTCDLAFDDCLIEVRWTNKTEISQEEIENLTARYFDYDFPPIKKLGLYFAQQGKLLTCEMWGKCPSDITIKDANN